MIKAILFDRDDTLCFSVPEAGREIALWAQATFGLEPNAVIEALQAGWAETAQTWKDLRTLEDERQFWDDYARSLSARLGQPHAVGTEMVKTYPHWSFTRPFPEAREVLTTLRNRGFLIGVLSNSLPDIRSTLAGIGLDDLIDVALASCALGHFKPEPEAFKKAAEHLGHALEDILFVDDKLENVETAWALGMQGLHIRHGMPEQTDRLWISDLWGVLDHLGLPREVAST
ncbi:MAG: HAD-IA family hydrolase [Deinococcaceae bacterium]